MAPSERPGRLAELDALRGFVVALVVLHHSILAYCRFAHFDPAHYLRSTAPVVDPDRWAGFDVMVLFNDGYFMPLLFLLSGLFVWPGLRRHGAVVYLRQRLVRLGLPFVASALLLVPLAYYPSFRLAGGDFGMRGYWLGMVSTGPWPSGPGWFIAVLLLFDAAAALGLSRVGIPAPGAREWPPQRCFAALLGVSAVAYLPLLAIFGPSRWLSFGPAAVQASRIGLYAAYFAAGIWLGRRGVGTGLVTPGGALAARWPGWALLALAAFAVLLAAEIAGLRTAGLEFVIGAALLLFCAAAVFAFLAAFLAWAGHPPAEWRSLAANSFAIYLLHYPVVTWLQFAFLDIQGPAVVQGPTVFVVALLVSWAVAAVLRRLPFVSRVI